MISKLQTNAALMHKSLEGVRGLKNISDARSPVIHLVLENPTEDRASDDLLILAIVEGVRERGFAVLQSKYVEDEEKYLPPPSVRILVHSDHSAAEIKDCAKAVADVAGAVLRKTSA
jgi:serine palmitoyltransferase